MPEKIFTRSDDLALLNALDLCDHDGWTIASVAKDLGLSKNQMIGKLHRVRITKNTHSCLCEKPENMDGGMPRRWWERSNG
jgi:hypothetical protein